MKCVTLQGNQLPKKLISVWAHFAACPKRQNRAIRSNSSTLHTQSLRDFRFYPLRSSRANRKLISVSYCGFTARFNFSLPRLVRK